ncbi:MAG: zf-HC2 domain-containing protein [Kofleriaceae bacterium]|nr:zf-HC2 domain-containing protein [Kofleriaceae bacterium]
MSCDDVRTRLTAYLDGELEGERGSVVRGHLRECAACRQVATDEAALRDGLRMLAPVDPPASLWAGVQAQLAAAEVADAKKPAWKRALARWTPSMPQFAFGSALAAAAIAVVWWRVQRTEETVPVGDIAVMEPLPVIRPEFNASHETSTSDVTAALAAEAQQVTDRYADTAEELLALATQARDQWPEDRRTLFDARVVELRAAIADAAPGRPQQKAWRALIRYLQGAAVRDEIAFAGVAP